MPRSPACSRSQPPSDIEVQTTNTKHLPRRVRYYQGLIDLNILEKGEDYRALRMSYVRFIATYDPFGKGRYVYTFENRCKEDPELALGNDAVKSVVGDFGGLNPPSTTNKAPISTEIGALCCFSREFCFSRFSLGGILNFGCRRMFLCRLALPYRRAAPWQYRV